MIPGPRLFRSRWLALLWAAVIVWLAVDIAAGRDASGTGNPATEDAAIRSAADAMGG